MGVKAQPFLVTGTPRSRTAWLSVLLTTDRTVAYHEPSAYMDSLETLERIFDSRFYSHVGVADSGLGFFAQDILKRWKPRTLIVERDLVEVEDSLARLGLPPTNYCELLMEHLEAVRNDPLVLWVAFDELSEKRVIERIFWHLLPGVAFDESRFEMLDSLLIEVDPVKTMMAFQHNAANLTNMLAHLKGKIALRGSDGSTLH